MPSSDNLTLKRLEIVEVNMSLLSVFLRTLPEVTSDSSAVA